VSDGIAHNVRRVHVRKLVYHLASAAARSHKPGPTKHAEMLADEGLRRPNRIHELVYAVGVIRQQVDDGQSNRSD
jgi:hypothetical protein